ncbi:MAG TPA: ABC transporter ATP-binding protein [Stellaceae bacterium]|nr:ABC transporter ATP-binding protein [Stellaceae bacterium]
MTDAIPIEVTTSVDTPVAADALSPSVAGQTKRRPLITLSDVRKIYRGGTLALADVNLTVGNGEFISILGPSGCGKSTLLRMIAGLGGISGGAIDWPQSRYNAHGEPIRDLGFVFQEPTLMPWATVFNNIYLPLKLSGVSRRGAEARVKDVIAMVGLEKFAHAYPRQLSGGMKMRVSIARALVVKPRVLLLDEPFAALDEITRFRLNNDLLRLWQDQKWTVIFVTHSVFESVYLSNRIVVMSARPGRIIADLSIPVPYPRGEAFRMSTDYNEFCRTTSTELSRAMVGVAEEEH